jgi:hypothetical protein
MRRPDGNRRPTKARIPNAKAVSVDIAALQPCAEERPAFTSSRSR